MYDSSRPGRPPHSQAIDNSHANRSRRFMSEEHPASSKERRHLARASRRFRDGQLVADPAPVATGPPARPTNDESIALTPSPPTRKTPPYLQTPSPVERSQVFPCLEQSRPQEPQLVWLWGVSQPSARPTPVELQSKNPFLQVATLHWAKAHLSARTLVAANVAAGNAASQSTPVFIVAFAQPPQLFLSLSVSTSQPSPFELLQSCQVP